MKSETFRINGMPGRIYWLTSMMLFLLYGFGEFIARLNVFQSSLTPVSLGSSHPQLGQKLALLDSAQKKGLVECIAVGSSMIDVGFDPGAFEQSYYAATGRNIDCFNFGIDASSSISTAAVVRILIDDYHPRLLIVGTDPRDYALGRENGETAVVLDTPWVQFRQGIFSLEGWVQEHSYLYRYRQHLARLARFDFDGVLKSHTQPGFEIRSDGYNPVSKIATYINDPPSLADESYEVIYYTKIYSSYQMLGENLDAMGRIMDHRGSGVSVIIVEMPVADGLYYFFGNREIDYNRFVQQVAELSERNETPFLRTEPLNLIPDDGWSDYSHLNTVGAEIFSIWLGQEVAKVGEQPTEPCPSRK